MLVSSRSRGGDGSAPEDCHTAPYALLSGWKEPYIVQHSAERSTMRGAWREVACNAKSVWHLM